MKKLLMIFLLVGISVSFYSCGSEDEPYVEPYYPENDYPPTMSDLEGNYVYVVSGEMTMTAEGYSEKMDIKDLVHYDGIELTYDFLNDRQTILVYKENGLRDYTDDEVPFTISGYNLMLSSETGTKTEDGVTMHLTLNHGIATISNDKKTITWTTTISGLATIDGVPPITVSGSYTNKAVKE